MYEVFEQLLKRNHVTPYRVYKETGVPQSTLSDWKNSGHTPGAEHLKKIAAYFSVTVDYLLGNEQKNKPPMLLDDLTETELELIKKLREGPADVTAAVYRAAGVNYPDKK